MRGRGPDRADGQLRCRRGPRSAKPRVEQETAPARGGLVGGKVVADRLQQVVTADTNPRGCGIRDVHGPAHGPHLRDEPSAEFAPGTVPPAREVGEAAAPTIKRRRVGPRPAAYHAPRVFGQLDHSGAIMAPGMICSASRAACFPAPIVPADRHGRAPSAGRRAPSPPRRPKRIWCARTGDRRQRRFALRDPTVGRDPS